MGQGREKVLCVDPAPDGHWVVHFEGETPLSRHVSANEAEAHAVRQASVMRVERIVLRDRYSRSRTIRAARR